MRPTIHRAVLLVSLAALLLGFGVATAETPGDRSPAPPPEVADDSPSAPELPWVDPEFLMSLELSPEPASQEGSCDSKECRFLCPEFGGFYIGGSGEGSCICC